MVTLFPSRFSCHVIRDVLFPIQTTYSFFNFSWFYDQLNCELLYPVGPHTMKKPFVSGKIVLCCFVLLLVTGIESTWFDGAIYNYLPAASISFCSRKLNISSQVGCSSKLTGSAGILWMANNSDDVTHIISETTSRDVMLVLDFHLFINVSLMRSVRLSPIVTGLLVFSPLPDFDTPPFSESSGCPNSESSFYGPQHECNVTPMWNPAGSEYSSIDWPFPVALVQDPNDVIKVRNPFYFLPLPHRMTS